MRHLHISHATGAYLVPTTLLILFYFAYAAGVQYGWIETFLAVFRDAVPLLFLSLGAALVLSSGYVDLSSAGVATLSGFSFVWLLFAITSGESSSLSLVWIICAAIIIVAAAFVVGAALGVGIVKQRAPPLLLTWAFGTLLFLVPLPLIAFLPPEMHASGASVPAEFLSTLGIDLSSSWYSDHHGSLFHWIFLGFGALAIWAVGAIILVLVVIGFTNLDRRACAIGANDLSAYYAGVDSAKTAILVYGVAGALSALGGVFYVLVNQSAPLDVMRGYELYGIAIAVLGGTSMSGGFLYLRAVVVSALAFSAIRFFTNDLLGLDEQQGSHCGPSDIYSRIMCSVEPNLGLVVYSVFFLVFIVVVLSFGKWLSPNVGAVLKDWEQDLPK